MSRNGETIRFCCVEVIKLLSKFEGTVDDK